MKIGFLITYFYPKIGGAENNCYYLARELVNRGHEVHVFTSGEKESEENIEGIKVHRNKEVLKLSYYLRFYPSIIRKLIKIKLDVLHLHGFGFIQHDWALRKYKNKYPDTKIFCTPHGPIMALKHYNTLLKIMKSIYLNMFRLSLRKYDKIVQVNPYQIDWMVRDYLIQRERIILIPNGIPYFPRKRRVKNILNKTLKKYGLKDKFIITYLGRIQKYKGIEQVVEIMIKLRNIKKDIVFVCIGEDAEYKEVLIKKAEELNVSKNILFTGRVSEEEKNSLLESSEIFVFPSEWEAFGISTLEAMAKGNAIISSRTEGGRYLIEEGKNGFLFDYGNLKELENKMKKVILNDKIRRKMQLNNIRKSKKFLWKDIALNLERYYKLELKKHDKNK